MEEINWGFKVKALREKMGMIQTELADKSGLKRSHLSRIELGDYQDAKTDVLEKLAKGFGMSLKELRRYIYDIYPEASIEAWDEHAGKQPLAVPVYRDFARVHAGEPQEAMDVVYVPKPELARYNIKSYLVEGDCMEPYFHNGEYVIVDHDRASMTWWYGWDCWISIPGFMPSVIPLRPKP